MPVVLLGDSMVKSVGKAREIRSLVPGGVGKGKEKRTRHQGTGTLSLLLHLHLPAIPMRKESPLVNRRWKGGRTLFLISYFSLFEIEIKEKSGTEIES